MSMESIEFTRIPDARELAHAYIDITRTLTIRNGEEWTAFDQITQMIESDRASIAAQTRAECAERAMEKLKCFADKAGYLEPWSIDCAVAQMRLAITQGQGDHIADATKKVTEQRDAQEKYYWWCPECKEEVDGHNVTLAEYHDKCGAKVIAKSTKTQPDLRDEVVTLREKVERQMAALNKIEGWLVCAGVTTADDMAKSFESMLNITLEALAQIESKKAVEG